MTTIPFGTGVARWCSTCRADVDFEQPECLDGHGGDCPEWVCARCGGAVLVGFAPTELVVLGHPTAHVA